MLYHASPRRFESFVLSDTKDGVGIRVQGEGVYLGTKSLVNHYFEQLSGGLYQNDLTVYDLENKTVLDYTADESLLAIQLCNHSLLHGKSDLLREISSKLNTHFDKSLAVLDRVYYEVDEKPLTIASCHETVDEDQARLLTLELYRLVGDERSTLLTAVKEQYPSCVFHDIEDCVNELSNGVWESIIADDEDLAYHLDTEHFEHALLAILSGNTNALNNEYEEALHLLPENITNLFEGHRIPVHLECSDEEPISIKDAFSALHFALSEIDIDGMLGGEVIKNTLCFDSFESVNGFSGIDETETIVISPSSLEQLSIRPIFPYSDMDEYSALPRVNKVNNQELADSNTHALVDDCQIDFEDIATLYLSFENEEQRKQTMTTGFYHTNEADSVALLLNPNSEFDLELSIPTDRLNVIKGEGGKTILLPLQPLRDGFHVDLFDHMTLTIEPPANACQLDSIKQQETFHM